MPFSKTVQLICLLLVCLVFRLSAQQWVVYDSSNSGLTNNYINCLQFQSDTLWVGTENGLYSYQNNQWINYPNQPFFDIRSLATEPNGTLWVGSFLNGLSRFDGTSWTYYTTSNSGLQSNFIRAIAFDSLSATLWVGTTNGLHALQNGLWTYYSINNSNLPGNNIPCLAIEQSILWGGTINNGLFKLSNGVFTSYKLNNSGIGDNTIRDIEVDAQGNKWLATPANGLSALSNTGSWSVFSIFNSGIHSNSLTAVGLACGNAFLGSTTAGLSTFGSWITYDTSNSDLPVNEIIAIETSNDSTIYLGTEGGGVAIFKPCFISNTDDLKESPSINIFPNPAQDFLTINLDSPNKIDHSLTIYDSMGRQRHHSSLSNTENKINISHLEQGHYLLSIKTKKHFFRELLIINYECFTCGTFIAVSALPHLDLINSIYKEKQ